MEDEGRGQGEGLEGEQGCIGVGVGQGRQSRDPVTARHDGRESAERRACDVEREAVGCSGGEEVPKRQRWRIFVMARIRYEKLV